MFDRFQSEKDEMTQQPEMRWFVVLWIGQLLSLICSGMTCFAQTVYTYTDLAGSITNMAILVALSQLPGILIAPLAGLIADRFNRRWVMFICNAIAAFTTLYLRSLVVSGTIEIWHMYVLVTIIATANAFQWPAYFATVPMMVPFKHLGRANGMVQTARTLSQLAAPAIAAWLVFTIRIEGIVLFDMVSYIIAAGILLYVKIPPTPVDQRKEVGQKTSLMQETFQGWNYLIARSGLIGLMALFATANFVFAASIVIILPLTLAITDVTQYGLLMTASGTSALIGSFMISLWGGPKLRIYGVFGALSLVSVGYFLSGVQPTVLFVFSGYILVSFAMPFVNTISGVIWQSKVPMDMQGRVMAATGMVSTFAFQLGYLLTGLTADNYFVNMLESGTVMASILGPIIGTEKGAGLSLMFALMGIIQFLFVGIGFLYPHLRRIDSELPDAVVEFAKTEVEKQAVGIEWHQIDLTKA